MYPIQRYGLHVAVELPLYDFLFEILNSLRTSDGGEDLTLLPVSHVHNVLAQKHFCCSTDKKIGATKRFYKLDAYTHDVLL